MTKATRTGRCLVVSHCDDGFSVGQLKWGIIHHTWTVHRRSGRARPLAQPSLDDSGGNFDRNAGSWSIGGLVFAIALKAHGNHSAKDSLLEVCRRSRGAKLIPIKRSKTRRMMLLECEPTFNIMPHDALHPTTVPVKL
jgi:hypothetical protein